MQANNFAGMTNFAGKRCIRIQLRPLDRASHSDQLESGKLQIDRLLIIPVHSPAYHSQTRRPSPVTCTYTHLSSYSDSFTN